VRRRDYAALLSRAEAATARREAEWKYRIVDSVDKENERESVTNLLANLE